MILPVTCDVTSNDDVDNLATNYPLISVDDDVITRGQPPKSFWLDDGSFNSPVYDTLYAKNETQYQCEEIVLLSDDSFVTDQGKNILMGETIGMGIIDCGCVDTVCGQTWFRIYHTLNR